MFKTAEKTELSQVSLTGMRAIVMLGLLIIKPRSLEEIRKAFIDLNIMEESHSDDILRIDLNTLKIMGCEISRSAPKTNFKYVLTKHPFELKISDEEINVLKKVYNRIKEQSDISLLIEYHELFNTISTFIFDKQTKEALLGVSLLKYYNLSFIRDLLLDCKQKRVLTLVYKKPTAPKEETKEIIAQELVLKNDKIYLHAYDTNKKDFVVLNIKRIVKILTRKLEKGQVEVKTTKVLFLLKGFDTKRLEAEEIVVEKENEGLIIEGSYYNEFIATQRILSFGSDCVVIEPLEFKNHIVEKIKEMKNTYGD